VTELLLDQAAGLRKLLNQSQLRTIAIASAAPGAGRTTIAANLAVAFAQKGNEVLARPSEWPTQRFLASQCRAWG